MTTARLASILGHPLLTMAVATAVSAGSGRLRWQALGAVAVVAAAVMLYSTRQVRSGGWVHIDASQKHERSQFNRFASWFLLGLATLLALIGTPAGIVAAIGLSGLLVLSGQLLLKRLKSSLHVAFGVFAAGIAWPDAMAAGALLAVAAVVAWSRLALGRHVAAELVSGAVMGLVAGLAFQRIIGP